jgi:hypothetical protein
VVLESESLPEFGVRLALPFLEVPDAGVTVMVGTLVMVPGVPALVLLVLEERDDMVVVWFK